jgi:hypothetical protein
MDDWSDPGTSSGDPPSESPGESEPIDSDSDSLELRVLMRLGQPFGALLLAQQRGGEYKRIASESDYGIMAQVKDVSSVGGMMDVSKCHALKATLHL